MMERIWNPAAGKTYSDFDRRWAACDRLLDLRLQKTTKVKYTELRGRGG